MLTEKELERYSRQIVMRDIGVEGQGKLKRAKVCVVGVGGLGCVSALQLAAMGVGYIRVVDRDVVDIVNLHRQHLYDMSSVGHPKVEIAARKLQALNPEVKVDPVPLSVDFDTAEDVVKDVDIIIDGLDRFAPRYALNRACVKRKVPYIFGAALEVYGNLSTIIPGETACLECLFPDVRDESLPTCESVGVVPPVPSVVASIQVQEALRLILGKEPRLTNKLLFCDLRSMLFEEFPFAKRADCSACGKVSVAVSVVKEKRVAELCGKNAFTVTPAKRISLDMPKAAELLSKKFHVKVRAHFGVTFDTDGISISLMKTGCMLIKGVKDQEIALKMYDDIMRVVAS